MSTATRTLSNNGIGPLVARSRRGLRPVALLLLRALDGGVPLLAVVLRRDVVCAPRRRLRDGVVPRSDRSALHARALIEAGLLVQRRLRVLLAPAADKGGFRWLRGGVAGVRRLIDFLVQLLEARPGGRRSRRAILCPGTNSPRAESARPCPRRPTLGRLRRRPSRQFASYAVDPRLHPAWCGAQWRA